MLTSPTRQPSALFEPSWETARRTLLLRDILRQNHATKVHSVLLGATIKKSLCIMFGQETKRHRRLCKKAARLDVKDLLEICAIKGMKSNDMPEDGASSSTPGAAGSGSPPPPDAGAATTPPAATASGATAQRAARRGPGADGTPSDHPEAQTEA
jgi:hypothetical protein